MRDCEEPVIVADFCIQVFTAHINFSLLHNSSFNGENCPTLIGKPKIFILQVMLL